MAKSKVFSGPARPNSKKEQFNFRLSLFFCLKSAESEGLSLDTSKGLGREKTKNIFLYFFSELKSSHLSDSIYNLCSSS